MPLAPGQTVLEVGPGPGVFTVPVARAIGPTGRLVAIDLQPAFLARTRAKVAAAGLTNVTLEVADAQALPLADQTFDLVFFVAVLGEIPHKGRALAEAHRVTKPEGHLVVTELLPDPDYLLPGTGRRLAGWAGFRPEARFGHLVHHTQVFVRD